MQKLIGLVSVLWLIFMSSSAISEVVVKEEPLTWDKSGHLPGEQMYVNLCAACHGIGGKGDGKAAAALDIHAPDLTVISANNGGVFPHNAVERSIADNAKLRHYGDSVMPAWKLQFMWGRKGLTTFQRESYARNRIHELAVYLEEIQGS